MIRLRIGSPRQGLQQCSAKDLCGRAEWIIEAMGDVSFRGELPLPAQSIGEKSYQTALTDVALDLSSRQASPAKARQDHGMFGVLTADAAGLRREHPEAAPLR